MVRLVSCLWAEFTHLGDSHAIYFFYYRSICIIDDGASRGRTRNARFRARRTDHSTTHAIVFRMIACTWQKTQPLQVIAFCKNLRFLCAQCAFFAETSLSYWSIYACIHCRFSVNSMNSRCLHFFPFNLSRIKFLVANWIGLFLLSCFPVPFLARFTAKWDPWARSKRVAVAHFLSWTLYLSSFRSPLPLLFLTY